VARGWPVREARRNARLQAIARARIARDIGLAASWDAQLVMRRDATGAMVPCLRINLAQIPPWLRDRAAAALAPALID
jgi:hypothetical protein